jgi:D-alanyl-D-alanine carboxypeptidase/D-alanyl-D-alanine-endopeptidase (penicillin-binding protein 4)
MTKLGSSILSIGLFALLIPNQAQAQILGIKGEKHSSIGIYIKDLNADTIVVDYEAERNLAPASIMKSFTTASALSLLGKDYQYKTGVRLVGKRASQANVWDGNLVIIPSGDPTIESSHFERNKGFCDSIVSNLKRLGIDKISGSIKVSENLTDAGPVSQWEIDDVAWPYGAGLFDFNYRDNTFSICPATKTTRPYIPNLNVTNVPTSGGNDVARGIYSNNLYIYGSALSDAKNWVSTTMPHPADVFVYELTGKLKAAGINVADRANSNTLETVTVYEHTSPKLLSIMQSLMERSDNMFAEGVLRALAPRKSRSAAINAELTLWRNRGLETDYVTVKDGSGLARVNRVSPQFLGDVLAWMAKSKMSKDYVSLFPIAGKTGTVKSFLLNTRLSGKMVLKTGSMNGVQCYAGYKIDDLGRPTHVVVIMVNSFYGTRADLRTAITNLLLKKL